MAALLPLHRVTLEPFCLLRVELILVMEAAPAIVGVKPELSNIADALLVDRDKLLLFVCDEWAASVGMGGGATIIFESFHTLKNTHPSPPSTTKRFGLSGPVLVLTPASKNEGGKKDNGDIGL